MGEVVFFGVRHHSPAGARLVVDQLRRTRPSAVLIEGPSEFNDQIDELDLDHRLPVMVYSWAPLHPDADPSTPDGAARRAGFYPLCDYSPEWVALRAARAAGIPTSFIDLPWLAISDVARAENRFAEPEPDVGVRPGTDDAATDEVGRWRADVDALERAVGVDRFDLLSDELFEIDPDVDLDTYRERMGMLGSLVRRARPDEETAARELFMASRIREVAAACDGPVLVVCGAAHVDGLRALLDQDGPLAQPEVEAPPAGDDRYGIALTPTSYAALDALDGYDAGQPTPGFYDQLFRDRAEGRADTAERMLTAITADLRGLGVFVSPADLIAVLATTRGLAGLRGHAQPWRTDLLDGITGALVKDDAGERHPLLARAVEVMRGDRVGRLAEGARRPPLVVELTAEMEALGLVPRPAARLEKADLTDPIGLRRSRLLHALRLLEVPVGTLERTADIDGVEHWRLQWQPQYEGALVMAARHGATREAAVTAVLLDRAAHLDGDPRAAASLVLAAALCGTTRLGAQLESRARQVLGTTGDLPGLGEALAVLMQLYRYDPLLRANGRTDLGGLVSVAFDRALRLVERLGPLPVGPASDSTVAAIRTVVDVLERCLGDLALDAAGWDRSLDALVADDRQAPGVRGAALGARWLAGTLPDEQLARSVHLVADPEGLGEFTAGLLAVAREAVLRRPALVLELDAVMTSLDERDFLLALPGLRRAFSAYAPRERSEVARTVLGEQAPRALEAFSQGVGTAAELTAFEAEVAATVARFLGEGVLA